jgi:(E)-4-hydroxy-3-methylbut-2-enyl-diphosphate synthase
VGNIPLGGDLPIRIQSMTTVDTMDTSGSVEQSKRIIDAGSDYVRLTAPSLKEARNLEKIKNELLRQGYDNPLIADIHFTPNAAELAAQFVEKVRINPGNYADKKKFELIEYTDESYTSELERIKEKFLPLVEICKENHTAMRIGTNHGSLSDRIMSRYGDTPLGMVESALEFIRLCEDSDFFDLVLSMKSSNPQVMVHAYRLLVERLNSEGLKPYPLHLGVTEAGEGEDGRIKSALGIGMLLEDGLGDTVRVSLTEEPEYEVPVARALVEKYSQAAKMADVPPFNWDLYKPFEYEKRRSKKSGIIGGDQAPVVLADLSDQKNITPADLEDIGHFYYPGLDKWKASDLAADFIYLGKNDLDFELPGNLRTVFDFQTWEEFGDEKRNISHPIISFGEFSKQESRDLVKSCFVMIGFTDLEAIHPDEIGEDVVFILDLHAREGFRHARSFFIGFKERDIENPVIIRPHIQIENDDSWLIDSSVAGGGPLIDGFGDGIWINSLGVKGNKTINQTSFGILQATRTRISKTEYISCPSCGRTLFDLQETTALIREKTDHLIGVKIAIMGCIVNGPGEMADANYGYVGSGKGKITLYRGHEVVKRGVVSENAVDDLIEIIKEDGVWTDPNGRQGESGELAIN